MAESVANLSAAIALHRAGRLEEAEPIYRAVLQALPNDPTATQMLGALALQQCRFSEAIELLELALQLKPRWPEALHNLGFALFKSGDYPRAIDTFQQATSVHAGFFEPWLALGDAFRELSRLEEATDAYECAINLRPENISAIRGLAATRIAQGRTDESISLYQRAVAKDPKSVAAAYDLAFALDAAGSDKAGAAMERAFALNPSQAHFERAIHLLRLGNFTDGWWHYDRHRELHLEPLALPKWNGEPLPNGSILLLSDEGLGDGINWIRYAAMVKARVGRVSVVCEPELVRLFQSMPEIDEVGTTLRGPFDTHSILSRLNFVFGTTVDTIPANVPYLHASPDAASTWRRRIEELAPGKFRVGLVWAGGSANKQSDRMRSCKLAELAPLFAVENVAFFSLQKGEGARQVRGASLDIIHLGDELTDFADTAAVLANLDLLISVDTSVAHLAGAMGMPVWTMLQAAHSDFRWLLGREDTPWYPTMRLFRLQKTAEWKPVIERMAGELSRLSKSKLRSQ